MAEDCKPSYKNLNRIQSFSEQGYATIQLMQQACMNDEWLRRQVEQLKYMSPPAIRKYVSLSNFIDETKSYGYNISGDKVYFSNSTTEEVQINFDEEDYDKYVDNDKTTCVPVNEIEHHYIVSEDDEGVENYALDDGKNHRGMEIPFSTEDSEEYHVTNAKKTNGSYENINSYWYTGFDRAKSYYIKPEWVKKWYSGKIPSVLRAQTFKVPATKRGVLESITLAVQSNGIMAPWSPFYVQLWEATKVKRRKVEKYDRKTLKPVYQKDDNEKPVYEYVYKPNAKKSSLKKPLASQKFNIENMSPGWHTFTFDRPCKIGNENKPTYYALVVGSPLSHPDYTFRIGGWGLNCEKAKDKWGDAWTSESNGKYGTWKRYGKADGQLDYRYGKNMPMDFAYDCLIRIDNDDKKYITNTVKYVYLKPIYSNTIKSFRLSAITGEVGGSKIVSYEYSVNGSQWHPMEENERQYLNTPYSNVLGIRIGLFTGIESESPSILRLGLTLFLETSKEMYVRTKTLNPKLSPMLGANIWGRIYAPFELEPTTNCNVEIIDDNVVSEDFHIITAKELEEYVTKTVDSQGNTIYTCDYEGVDAEKLVLPADENGEYTDRYNYLIQNHSVLEEFKKDKIYIKPYYMNDKWYGLSFYDESIPEYIKDADEVYTENPDDEAGFVLNNPAYPIVSVKTVPEDGDMVQAFAEKYDYTMDYTTNKLKLRRNICNEELSVGTLTVSYNKVIIKGLTQSEVGLRVDSETGLQEEGLVLDYFKEDFVVSSEQAQTRTLDLRVSPVEPIKSVILNKDTDDEQTLYENYDFTVDSDNRQLIFNVANIDGVSSALKTGDKVEVVYTPNIDTPNISIGYFATRTNTDKQCIISSPYFEYKA